MLLGVLAAAPAAAAAPQLTVVRIVPLSGGLGLADVLVQAPEGAVRAEAIVAAAGKELARGELRRGTPEGGNVRFAGRFMAGPTAPDTGVTVRVWWSGRPEPESHGPVEFETDPPPGQRTPDWAKGAVWYQIFPERFRNGNPANDPAAPAFAPKAWMSDWFAFDVDELEAARARVTLDAPHELRAMPDPRIAALQARRYGGDLEGVAAKLDELRDLGVTAIYLNPVFAAHSHHKYDATDFRHIDPALAGDERELPRGETEDPATWVWTQADRYVVDELLPAVHDRGMRIVFDGVWNHVGTRFWAFADVLARGRESAYADWFAVEFADAARLADERVQAMGIREGGIIAWKSWNSMNGSLPVFWRGGNGRLREGVERHIWEVTRRWMSPGDGRSGIDGWRLDVAPDLPRPFWEAWCAHARSVNEEALLIGEFWFDAREYFSGGSEAQGVAAAAVFDGQMNYPVAMPLVRWLADEGYSSAQLGAQLARVLERPAQHELVQINLLGSHDTARVATMIEAWGAGLSEYGGQIPQRIQRSRPGAAAYDKVALGVAVLACWPGSPMVYYGDEYGMHGGNDPHCRKPLPWPDLGPPENEADRAEPGLRERFRAWLRLRQDTEIGDVLRYGDVRIIETGSAEVLAFERSLNGKRVLCVANRGDAEFDAARLITHAGGTLANALWRVGGEIDGRDLRIPARGAGVFEMVNER